VRLLVPLLHLDVTPGIVVALDFVLSALKVEMTHHGPSLQLQLALFALDDVLPANLLLVEGAIRN